MLKMDCATIQAGEHDSPNLVCFSSEDHGEWTKIIDPCNMERWEVGNSSVRGKRRHDRHNRPTGHFFADYARLEFSTDEASGARNVIDCANFFQDSLAGSMQKSAMDVSNDESREVAVVMQNYRSLDGLAHLASENTSAYSN